MTLHDLFSKIFSKIPDEVGFSIFSWQYFILLLFEIAIPVALAIIFAKKLNEKRDSVLRFSAIFLITIYIADFFVQPFYAGTMIPHKLPFHICTATGVLLTFVTLNKKFEKMSKIVTVWAIISPLLWMIFPFDTYDIGTSLFSYSLIQPIIYHMVEFFWGLYMLISGKVQLPWKTLWQPIVALFPMAIWATIGQELYFPNELGENFLMLRTDTTGICPHWVFIVALFLAATIVISLVYLIYYLIVRAKDKKTQKVSDNVD